MPGWRSGAAGAAGRVGRCDCRAIDARSAAKRATADSRRRRRPVTSTNGGRCCGGCRVTLSRRVDPDGLGVAGLATGLERLDDDHAAAAAGTRGGEHGLRPVIGGSLLLGIGGGARAGFEKLARLGDALLAAAAGEEAVMTDAMEGLGQDVGEETADELGDRKGHRRVAARALDPVVLDLEGDARRIGGDQAAVGDGDAVGVARQVGAVGLGSRSRLAAPRSVAS
jgi:hypothetical protein